MGAVSPARLIQAGKETTRGTEVAATARFLTRPGGVTWRDVTDKPPVESDYGLLDRRHSTNPAELARQSSELEMTADLSFEQILHCLEAGVKGAVTGSEVTSMQGDYKYTFTPNATADPAPDAYTLEYVEQEGTTNRSNITAVYGLCRRIRISGSQAAEYATLETEWFARKSTDKAETASIGLPTFTPVPAPKFIIEIATTFANLESSPTALAAQIIAFEWELVTGLMPKFRLDSNSPDFAAYSFGVRECTLALTLDLTAEAETERTARLQAAALQYFRVEAQGAQIGTGVNHRVTIDGCYELTDPVSMGDDNDGQSRVDLKYTAVHDATKGAAFEVEVVNTLTAVP